MELVSSPDQSAQGATLMACVQVPLHPVGPEKLTARGSDLPEESPNTGQGAPARCQGGAAGPKARHAGPRW